MAPAVSASAPESEFTATEQEGTTKVTNRATKTNADPAAGAVARVSVDTPTFDHPHRPRRAIVSAAQPGL
jgi:hypothetical protein